MSEIRRKLLIASSMGGDGSWYRICKGGIYTTTNAYIDTGYNNFTDRYMNWYLDCKVIVEEVNNRYIAGAYRTGSNDCYIAFRYCGTSNTAYYSSCYKTEHIDKGGMTNFANVRPYLNKKIRITMVPNYSSSVVDYIQFYDGDSLGTKIYANYSLALKYNNICQSSILIFNCHADYNLTAYPANNIAVYETCLSNNDIMRFFLKACQLTQNITADLAWDNKPHSSGEYGMYNEVDGKFYGNANSTGYFLENID